MIFGSGGMNSGGKVRGTGNRGSIAFREPKTPVRSRRSSSSLPHWLINLKARSITGWPINDLPSSRFIACCIPSFKKNKKPFHSFILIKQSLLSSFHFFQKTKNPKKILQIFSFKNKRKQKNQKIYADLFKNTQRDSEKRSQGRWWFFFVWKTFRNLTGIVRGNLTHFNGFEPHFVGYWMHLQLQWNHCLWSFLFLTLAVPILGV